MKKDPTGYNHSARAQMEQWGVNFSTSRELLDLLQGRKPGLRYEAKTPTEWKVWCRRFRAKLNQ